MKDCVEVEIHRAFLEGKLQGTTSCRCVNGGIEGDSSVDIVMEDLRLSP